MASKDDYEKVKKLIFNDDIQKYIEQINGNVLDYNILEITGMGSQEIRHSNLLSWLFSDLEHNLEYEILENFLKRVIKVEENSNLVEDINKLQEYIYLAKYEKDIVVYREKENIDILIVDNANKIVIAIENKVFSSERTDGEDGGQLKKYEDIINKNYSKDFEKYFIFLTPDLNEPSRDTWFRASYQMIAEVLNDVLQHKNISIKTKIILESYIDILKRRKVVEDEKLKELCSQIWGKPEYKEALEIINNYKPDVFTEISKYIQITLKENYSTLIDFDDSNKSHVRFFDKIWNSELQNSGNGWTSSKRVVLYDIVNREKSALSLFLIIGPTENQEFREKLYKIAEENKGLFKPSNSLSQKWSRVYSLQFISKNEMSNVDFENIENIKMAIDEKLEEFFKEDGAFYKIRNSYKNSDLTIQK